MKQKAKVSITQLPTHYVAVNEEPVALNNGTGDFEVEEGERNILFWRVVGTPGTPYEIKITPSKAGKLDLGGPHPIKLKIANGSTVGGGHRYFRILAQEKSDE